MLNKMGFQPIVNNNFSTSIRSKLGELIVLLNYPFAIQKFSQLFDDYINFSNFTGLPIDLMSSTFSAVAKRDNLGYQSILKLMNTSNDENGKNYIKIH